MPITAPTAVSAAPVAAPAAAAAGCCAAEPSTAPAQTCGCSCGEAPLAFPVPPWILVEDAAPACACGGPSAAIGASSCCVPAAETPGGLGTATFRIEGLGCACEGAIVEKRVTALGGVEAFSLDPITNRMRVTYDRDAVSIAEITAAVTTAGASAVLVTTR